MKNSNGEESKYGVSKGAGRHDIAVIRPTEDCHVTNHEPQQEEDGHPNGGIGDGEPKRMRKPGRRELHRAYGRHAALQQKVSRIGAHYHRQDHDQRLEP